MNTKIFKLITVIISVLFAATTATAQEAKTMYVMRQGEVKFQSVISDIDSIIFYTPAPSIPEDGVLINGVVWAKYNVDAPGTFAANPESYGMFYQWGRPKAWPSDNIAEDWDPTYPEGDVWEKADDPSPAGWRMPTREDIQKLADDQKVTQTWVTENTIRCRKFTDNDTGDFILLPAAGFRYFSDGSVRYRGGYDTYYLGYYWGGESNDDPKFASGFDISSTEMYIEDPRYGYDRRNGFTIRCVAK